MAEVLDLYGADRDGLAARVLAQHERIAAPAWRLAWRAEDVATPQAAVTEPTAGEPAADGMPTAALTGETTRALLMAAAEAEQSDYVVGRADRLCPLPSWEEAGQEYRQRMVAFTAGQGGVQGW